MNRGEFFAVSLKILATFLKTIIIALIKQVHR